MDKDVKRSRNLSMKLKSDEDGWICSRRSGAMLHKNMETRSRRSKCEARIRVRGWSRWDWWSTGRWRGVTGALQVTSQTEQTMTWKQDDLTTLF